MLCLPRHFPKCSTGSKSELLGQKHSVLLPQCLKSVQVTSQAWFQSLRLKMEVLRSCWLLLLSVAWLSKDPRASMHGGIQHAAMHRGFTT